MQTLLGLGYVVAYVLGYILCFVPAFFFPPESAGQRIAGGIGGIIGLFFVAPGVAFGYGRLLKHFRLR